VAAPWAVLVEGTHHELSNQLALDTSSLDSMRNKLLGGTPANATLSLCHTNDKN
jgi:hypothetical protein